MGWMKECFKIRYINELREKLGYIYKVYYNKLVLLYLLFVVGVKMMKI